jgi:hypothetical protein
MTNYTIVPGDPDLQRLYAFWSDQRGERVGPPRAAFDPVTLRYVLGNLLLIDVLYDPLRFRYRLIGTNIVQRVGLDLTGQFVDTHPEPQFREAALQRYRKVVETRAPLCGVRNQVFDGRTRRYEVLMLPLSSDGATIDMIIVAMKFLD